MRKLHTLALLVGLVALIAPVKGDQCGFLLLGAGKCGASGTSPLLTNLAAYWDLDEASGNAIDAHASNDLVDENTVGYSATGGPNGTPSRDFDNNFSEAFDAGTDYADLSMGTDTPITMVAWIKADAFSGYMGIASKNDNEYGLYYNGGASDLRFFVNNGVSSAEADTAGSPSDGVKYFLVGQHDPVANTVGISVDDGAFVTTAWSGGTQDGTGEFYIGKLVNANYWFNGLISRVGVWKRVLSASEITWLYNSGNSRSYADVVTCSGC